jgi:hypothetical protein
MMEPHQKEIDSSKNCGSGKGRNFKGGKGKKPFKKKARQVHGKTRITATEPSGTTKDGKTNLGSTITISMKDHDNDGEPNSGDENNDGSNESNQGEQSAKEVCVDKPRKKKRKKPSARYEKSRQTKGCHQPRDQN